MGVYKVMGIQGWWGMTHDANMANHTNIAHCVNMTHSVNKANGGNITHGVNMV